ncbi:MAG: peptidylprolyl isomerase [Patescibacteria group bacterium]|jgi:foldase protein PrsA
MANPKITEENDINDQEIDRLRDIVLKWVDVKKEKPVLKQKIAPKIPKEIKPIQIQKVAEPAKANKPAAKISNSPVKNKPAETKKTLTPALEIIAKKPKLKIIPKISQIIIWLALLGLIALAGFGGYLYFFNISQNNWTEIITSVVPYPVAMVDWQPISYYQWQKEVDSLVSFYNKQKSNDPIFQIPSLKDTKKHILDRMIDQKLVEELAAKYNIRITNEEIEQQTQALAKEVGSEQNLTRQLADLYNWTIADFQAKIIMPVLLKNKLATVLTLDDSLNGAARKKIEEILKTIKTGKETFEQAAQKYSEDMTASQGGDLGYFGRGQMVPEFEKTAFALNPGEISDIIKTQFGYHLIKVEERLTDENGEVSQVRAKQILIRGKDLDSVINDLRKTKPIWQLIQVF